MAFQSYCASIAVVSRVVEAVMFLRFRKLVTLEAKAETLADGSLRGLSQSLTTPGSQDSLD